MTTAWQVCAAQVDSLAAHLVALGGHTKGVACVLRCGDGGLATAIGRNSGLVVLALDEQDANVAAARQSANSSGLLGRRVYVVQGAVGALPLADNYADLLVIADATDANLSTLSRSEILRVLAPVHGQAIIGNAGSGLTQPALQAWANGFAGAGVTVSTDSYGLWARITKPALSGSEDWAQRYHGPDNNPVSTDTALKYPFLTQWIGKPYHDITNGAEVHVANGRILTMCKYWLGSYGYTIRMNTCYMRSAYNGEVLWTRDLPLRYLTGFGAAVMSGDSVFMIVGDSVAVLDAETGVVKRRIGFTGLTGSPRRVEILNNVLVVLAGDHDMSRVFPATVTDKILCDSVFYGGMAVLGRHPPYPKGTEIAAYDLTTRQTLWRHVESSPIDLNHLALYDGKVIFYARESRAAAINITTGAEVWQNNSAAFLTAIAADTSIKPVGYSEIDGIMPQCALVAKNGRVIIDMGRSTNIVALSSDNGSVLWSVPNGIKGGWLKSIPIAQMLMGDTLYKRDVLINAATGSTLGTYQGSAPGCGVFTGGPGKIYGQLGISYDLTTRAATPGLSGLHHGICDVGSFIADGLYITSSFKCRCGLPARGYKVMGSAGAFQFNKTAVESERLSQAGDLSVALPLPVTAQDWFTYRANNQRPGSSTVAVSQSPHKMFTFAPDVYYYTNFTQVVNTYDVDWRITPPVAVGDYVFAGGWDGKVRCINTTSGRLEWQYACAGAVPSSPTVSEGRVFFGSCDGWAYACEARSGRLLWKFRAAPVERLVMQHGMLMSTWPVLGGVLVQDSVAYVAAGGVNAENGTFVYALNARTGRIVWQNDSLAAQPNAKNCGRTAGGNMAIAGGRLWLSTANRATFSLRLTDGHLVTGSLDEATNSPGNPGSDIAVFHDRFVMYGGRQFWSDHSERTGTEEFDGALRYAVFSFVELDGSGNAQYPEVAPYAYEKGVLTPVWDNDLMVLATDRISSVCGWDATAAATFLTQQRTANTGAQVVSTGWTPRWGALTILVNAMAIAQNAVVIAYRDNDNAIWDGWKDKLLASTWKIGLFNKQTGALLWSEALPVEPLRNGLCIDHSGNILVALRDGRVVCYGSGTVGIATEQWTAPASPTAVGPVLPAATARQSSVSPVSPNLPESLPNDQVRRLEPRRTVESAASPHKELIADASADPRDSCQIAAHSASSTMSDAGTGSSPMSEPRSIRWIADRPCLAVASVRSSSSSGINKAGCTVDRDLTTRWAPARAGAEWLLYDLGSKRDVSAVTVVWFSRTLQPVDLTITLSADGRTFWEADRGALCGKGTNSTLRSFSPQPARFVRIALKGGSSAVLPSVYEVGIHGSSAEASVQ
jgi:outer membrane protein assembly factor BamB